VPRHQALQRVVAGRVEGDGATGRRAEGPRQHRVGAELRVVQVARRQRLADIDADRHQHRLDPVVAEAVADVARVQDHVLRAELHLAHLALAFPADRQHAGEDEEALLDLMAWQAA
jgi:hypothetical protein